MDVNVVDTIEVARQQLENGRDKEAARLLTDAAYRTRDAEVGRKIRDLATLGRSRAGRFGRGRWDEIIRVADVRTGNGN